MQSFGACGCIVREEFSAWGRNSTGGETGQRGAVLQELSASRSLGAHRCLLNVHFLSRRRKSKNATKIPPPRPQCQENKEPVRSANRLSALLPCSDVKPMKEEITGSPESRRFCGRGSFRAYGSFVPQFVHS